MYFSAGDSIPVRLMFCCYSSVVLQAVVSLHCMNLASRSEGSEAEQL